MNKFWKWAKNEVSSNGSELILDGVIASESWWGDEVTPAEFRSELAAHSGNVTVRINSPGGDVFAGVAIYNALREHDGNVTVKVDGIAASIASLIAMAGDEIIMLPGSMMMVHEPWTFAAGNADELSEVVEMLQKTAESMVPIYVARTGQSEDKIRELLKAETWMDGNDAVDLGFATSVVEAKKSNLSASIKNALSYASSVKEAVTQPAMAMQTRVKAEDNKAPEVEEANVTDTAEATSEVADDSAEADADAQETETEEVTDPDVSDTQDNTVKKETTEMNDDTQTVIAKTQVIDPDKQAKPQEAKASTSYLKTPKAMDDFADILRANAGKTAQDVKAAWKGNLVKNGVTNPELIFPEPFVTEIKDQLEASQIYSLLNHTGLDALKIAWDASDPMLDTSRAGQHNPDYVSGGNPDKTKDQEIITLDDRELEPDYIYKYIVLDKKTIRKQRSSGALLRYILKELPAKIIAEIERAVLIGDGRASNHKRKITSFISVKADAVAGNTFASTYIPAADETRAESVAKAKDLIRTNGAVYMVAKKGYSTAARFEKNSNGDLLYPIGTKAIDIFEVQGIIEPTWFIDATDADYDAYLVVLKAYDTVGDDSIESFTNFKLETNENEYLQEIFKGGGLTGIKSAVGISKPAES